MPTHQEFRKAEALRWTRRPIPTKLQPATIGNAASRAMGRLANA